MKPISKAHSCSFAISTTVICITWKWLASIQIDCYIISLLVAFAMSLTFYKAVFHLILFLCEHFQPFKKLFLGKYYLEGIWIGFYMVNGSAEYYYEIFEQSLDETIIKGTAFGENHEYVGEWTIVNPTLNIAESKLTYYYEMSVAVSDDITVGHSRAIVYWDKGCACRLVGFAIDSFSKEKQKYISVKVKTKKDFQTWITESFWATVEMLSQDETKLFPHKVQ